MYIKIQEKTYKTCDYYSVKSYKRTHLCCIQLKLKINQLSVFQFFLVSKLLDAILKNDTCTKFEENVTARMRTHTDIYKCHSSGELFMNKTVLVAWFFTLNDMVPKSVKTWLSVNRTLTHKTVNFQLYTILCSQADSLYGHLLSQP